MDTFAETTTGDKERGEWSHKVEYLLSILGYLVGLGNLWRFPYICMRNGGGAFLIPYIICLVFCGLPLFFLETAIGQFTGKGFLHVWEVCPLFRGMGFGMLILLELLNIYYNMIIAWTLYYLGNCFISPLPWTTCSNDWNSPHCVEDRSLTNKTERNKTHDINVTGEVISKYNASWITAQEDFWQQNVLQMSDGIEHLGHVNWHLLLCLLGAWIIVGLCVIKGIKSVGKVVYITAILPYILLTVMLIKGLTLDGSVYGVVKFLKPDFEKLVNIQVWIEAFVQVFYSLGAGWGCMIYLASFNKFDNNFRRDAVMLCFVGEGTSLYSGLVIFTVLGFMATDLSISIDHIVKSGPGLGFVVYPEALALLPGQNIWSFLFFVMLLSVGLDSQFTGSELVIGAFLDTFPKLRKRRILLTGIVCLFNFSIGIVLCFEGGIYVYQLMDWYIAAFALPIFGCLECVIFSWIYGLERLSKDVTLMIGRGIPLFIRVCLGFITPVSLVVLIIFSFIGYKPPTYGSYQYPDYAVVIGMILSVGPMAPLLICGVLTVKNTQGGTILEKVKASMKPTKKWIPICKMEDDDYFHDDLEAESSFIQKLKTNVLGQR